jgi:hypothetical protein
MTDFGDIIESILKQNKDSIPTINNERVFEMTDLLTNEQRNRDASTQENKRSGNYSTLIRSCIDAL